MILLKFTPAETSMNFFTLLLWHCWSKVWHRN